MARLNASKRSTLPRTTACCTWQLASACHAAFFTGLLLATLFLAALPATAAAASDEATASAELSKKPRILNCRIGFQDVYRVGFWTPIWIDVVGGETPQTGHLEVIVPDNDGVGTVVSTPPERPISLEPGNPNRVLLYARIGQTEASVRVRLYADGRRADAASFDPGVEPGDRFIWPGMAANSQLLVEFGTTSVGLAEAYPNREGDYRQPARETVLISSPADLPTSWYGYDAVDLFVISGSDASLLSGLDADGARIAALTRWVELGGRLVILAGAEAPVLVGQSGPLSNLVPGRFDQLVTLDRGSALEQFADAGEAIPTTRGQLEITVARLTDLQGIVSAYEGRRPEDLPLVVRRPYGLGQVVFAGVDLDRAPLRGWKGRPGFLRELALLPDPKIDNDANASQSIMTDGYEDLSGALRQKLSNDFHGVHVVPFGWVAFLVLCYIALIGPIDYFLVKNVFKRMEWTWITFPLTVLLVSVAAYWYAYAQKGDELRINSAEVLDFDLTTGHVRGTLWTSLFSPRPDNYNLSLAAKWPDGQPIEQTQALVSWMGLPGIGIGGMQSANSGFGLFGSDYRYAPDLDQLTGVPIQVWSTKTFAAHWDATSRTVLQAELEADADGILTGTLTNQTGTQLRNARLLFGNWAWRLGDLDPGFTQVISPKLDPLKVKTLIGQQAGLPGSNSTGNTSYNYLVSRTATTEQLLNLLMFYEAAGGYPATHIWNLYESNIDLSHQLQLGHAILVATTDQPRSELLRDGNSIRTPHDRHVVAYRFLLPVTTQ